MEDKSLPLKMRLISAVEKIEGRLQPGAAPVPWDSVDTDLILEDDISHITKKFTDLPFLKEGFSLVFAIYWKDQTTQYGSRYECRVSLYNDRHEIGKSSVGYYFSSEDGFTASATGVQSDGFGVGSFVFNLQMILIILCQPENFALSNYTDDPARASEGIYKLLEWDMTDVSDEEQTAVEEGTTDILIASQGEMMWKPTLDTDAGILEPWKEHMNGFVLDTIQKNTGKEDTPWTDDAPAQIQPIIDSFSLDDIFTTGIAQEAAQGKEKKSKTDGGRMRKSRKKRSRKRKSRKRKSRKKRYRKSRKTRKKR